MPWIEGLVIAAMVLVIIVDVVAARHWAAAAIAGIAALCHMIRLAGWQGFRTSKDPIVWVLHLAYGCLPAGLALKAIHLTTGSGWAAQWLHVLTMGAAGMMIVAVITRAALGHTGRPLAISRSVAIAHLRPINACCLSDRMPRAHAGSPDRL